MTVKPDSPHRATHAEREYRFCSASCRDKFKRDPQKYLAPKTDQAAAEQGSADSAPPPGTEYTCPMHPEVHQIGPGTCPKCGMALEPMMVSLENEENPELIDFRRRFW